MSAMAAKKPIELPRAPGPDDDGEELCCATARANANSHCTAFTFGLLDREWDGNCQHLVACIHDHTGRSGV